METSLKPHSPVPQGFESLLVGDFDLMETISFVQPDKFLFTVPASRGLWFNGNHKYFYNSWLSSYVPASRGLWFNGNAKPVTTIEVDGKMSLLVGDFDLMETWFQKGALNEKINVPASRGLWFNGNIDRALYVLPLPDVPASRGLWFNGNGSAAQSASSTHRGPC